MVMRRMMMGAALVVAVAACGDGVTVRSLPERDEPERSERVYDEPTRPNLAPAAERRIDSETNCAALQLEFDTADANGNVDAMRRADSRMRSVGCY